MCQKDTGSNLSDEGTLTTHVRSCYNLQIGLALEHPAVIADAIGRVLYFNKGVSAVDQIDLLFVVLTDDGLNILVVGRDLRKSREHVQL